jgi:hypothetical protein
VSDDDDRGSGSAVGARVFGPDRFSTSVAISRYEFHGGASEVYLARADNFADAVAAGSLKKGPVLLVPDCGELPAVVAEEISRLHPRKVVALGGEAAICDDMLMQAIDAANAGRGGDRGQSADEDGDDEPRTESTQTADLAVGEQDTFDAGDAGTVTITRSEDGLELVEATPAEGWTVHEDDAELTDDESEGAEESDEVEVSFTDGTSRVDFKAELEEGRVEIRVRTRTVD